MENRCLVLSGRLLDEQDSANVHARMAAAFGMELEGFRERVFERAPLIIRRGLDATTADAQMAQLRGMGVEADVWPDSDRLIWLRRDGTIRGPLPEESLDRYAKPGDLWCHDGGQEWFAWQPPASTGAPPPLPPANETPEAPTSDTATGHTHSEPPPLPPSPPAVPLAHKPPLSTAAVVAALFGLLALLVRPLSLVAALLALIVLIYLYRRPLLRGRAYAVAGLALSAVAVVLWMGHPAPTPVVQQPYVPRPLKPLEPTPPATVASPGQCASKAVTAKNDEDRFLLTGQRMLTGRAQRKGDTYVAEAAVAVDAQCQPSALQLYVFRHGVFIGTALDKAATLAGTRLTDFNLIDDQHLRVTLAQCTEKLDDCAATTVRQFAVMPGGGGWTLGEMK